MIQLGQNKTHMKKVFFIIIPVLTLGCSSDNNELGNDYFFRNEGHEILNHKAGIEGIPPTIINYNYDRDYILAKQKPKAINDILHEDYNYKHGKDSTYYWVIIKKEFICLGPLDIREFDDIKLKHQIPIELSEAPSIP